MFQNPRRSRIFLAALGLICAFVAVGYFSNVITSSACERATSQWLKDQLVQFPPGPGHTASAKPAKFKLPWIVAVDYGWAVGPTGGEWGTRYYFTLLGIQIPVRNHIRIQS